MRRLVAIVLALLAIAPVSSALSAGTALATATGPALVPGALDGSATVRAGGLDASDRWIVVLRTGVRSDVAAARARNLGVAQDRVFNGAIRGYSARLTNAQLALLHADPQVETVVPDDILAVQGQTLPTGVSRVFGAYNPITHLDGTDKRVDADVAVVDTGIDPAHTDLNVVGGINCTTTTTTDWADYNGHGTHVAGTIGALDNGFGVVGVAPGVRLWSVRVLNSLGNGLLSWYVCGLDWIAAQRDPADPTRPLFEAVNMSVAKPGSDDHNCGYTNSDVMHRAICRVVGTGITVVAAAGNYAQNAANWIPAAYDEVITVSALSDSDGIPGGKGAPTCYSWNSYDQDDTFADFSDYGADVDLIAPGKCIYSTLPGNRYGTMSGTSMATPLVTGAAALYKASRPLVTPAQVKAALRAMGNLNWKTSTDPDPWHEPLLDVSWIVNLGDFGMRSITPSVTVGPAGGTVQVPMNVVRAEDQAIPIDLSAEATAPVTVSLSSAHLEAADPGAITVSIAVAAGTPQGIYPVTVTATDGTRLRSTVVRVYVDTTPPVAAPTSLTVTAGSIVGSSSVAVNAAWNAASDSFGRVAGYQAQWRVDTSGWGTPISLPATARTLGRTMAFGHRYGVRVRAQDEAGNWSAWAEASSVVPRLVDDRSPAITTTIWWNRVSVASAWGGTLLWSTQRGASVIHAFYGRGIAVVTPLAPYHGRFTVWIDDVYVGTVDEVANRYHARVVVFSRTLPLGTHTIRVRNDRTAGRYRVDFDAYVVLR